MVWLQSSLHLNLLLLNTLFTHKCYFRCGCDPVMICCLHNSKYCKMSRPVGCHNSVLTSTAKTYHIYTRAHVISHWVTVSCTQRVWKTPDSLCMWGTHIHTHTHTERIHRERQLVVALLWLPMFWTQPVCPDSQADHLFTFWLHGTLVHVCVCVYLCVQSILRKFV